jgi:AraC-like DNA-binding protein
MTLVWDSAALPAGERADALRETIRSEVVRVELDLPHVPERVRARVALTNLARVQICSVDAMPTTVTRTQRLARGCDEEPALFLSLQVSGTSMMVQHGREAVLHAGQFAVYTTTSPYTLLFEHGVHAHFFRFPLAELALPETAARDLCARPLGGPGDPLAELTSSYLLRLAASPELRSRPLSDALGQPTIELLRAALTAGNSSAGRDARHAALDVRILEYLRNHLADPDLSAATVAAAHHISVRHLYGVLSRMQINLGDWIRNQRLERCRQDLARPDLASCTISAIARRWAFADAAHFSRVFREAYGLAPREWRAIKLQRLPR